MKASDKYRLKIVPAGADDRLAEISDRTGNVVKRIYCYHRLGNNTGGLDLLIAQDFEEMEADAFAAKYKIPEEE